MLTPKVNPQKVNPCPKVNGSLPEKSEHLSDALYSPLAREAKMPEAQYSTGLALSEMKTQLDILTTLVGQTVRKIQL